MPRIIERKKLLFELRENKNAVQIRGEKMLFKLGEKKCCSN